MPCQGHVKVKVDTQLNLARAHGAAAAEEFAAFVNKQIYALKDTVGREELDCEFELRRSYDVFLDTAGAETEEKEFKVCLPEGQRSTRERQLTDSVDFAEQVTQNKNSSGYALLTTQVTLIKGAKIAVSSSACSFWPYEFVPELLAKLVAKGALNL